MRFISFLKRVSGYCLSCICILASVSPLLGSQEGVIEADFFGLEGFSAQPFRKGADNIPNYWNKIYAEAEDIGIGVIGFNSIVWELAEPKPPVNGRHRYQFQVMDEYVRNAQRYGFKIQAVLKCNSPWASAVYEKSNADYMLPLKDAHKGDWAKFVTGLVERYDGDGKHDMPGLKYPALKILTFGNELEVPIHWKKYGGTPESYHELLRITRKAAKKADPNIIITRSSWNYSSLGDPSVNPDIDRALSGKSEMVQNARNFLEHTFKNMGDADRFSLHCNYHYSSMIPVAEWIRSKVGDDVQFISEDTRSIDIRERNALSKAEDTFIRNAPKGKLSASDLKVKKDYEQRQATTVAKKVICAAAANYSEIIISAAADWDFYHIASWKRCGLFDISQNKASMRPAAYAYKATIDWLLGADRAMQIHSRSEDLYDIGFTKEGVQYRILWSETGKSYKTGAREAVVLPSLPGETAGKSVSISNGMLKLTSVPVLIQENGTGFTASKSAAESPVTVTEQPVPVGAEPAEESTAPAEDAKPESRFRRFLRRVTGS